MSVQQLALVAIPVAPPSRNSSPRAPARGPGAAHRRLDLVAYAPAAGVGAKTQLSLRETCSERPAEQRRARVSERELIRRARLGDRDAEHAVLELNEPLVQRVCRGFFLPNGEHCDLLQAARLGLWQAIRCWDPERGTQFRHFAMLVMRREVMMLVSSSRAHNQRLVNSAHSLQAEYGDEGGSGLTLAEVLAAPTRDANDPAECALWRERLALILANLPALSEHERGSLRMTLNGLSQPAIGAELGTSAKSINNALQRARRKLRAGI
jgi:RNA polymerase sporulation-specific sigma factor